MRASVALLAITATTLAVAGVGQALSGPAETSLASALPSPAPLALPAASPPASPATWPAAEPADVPAVTGPATIVARAASMLVEHGSVPLHDQRVLAAEQQLRSSLQPSTHMMWTLGRYLPPAPLVPSIVHTPSPAGIAIAPVGKVAVVAMGALGLLAVAFPRFPILPLYSRIEREEAMLNSRRSQLYELVRAEPGIHLSDLVRRSGLGWGAALYHLSVLEKNRVLVVQAQGGFKRYFANGQHHRHEMPRLAALRHEAARLLFEAIQAVPGRSGRELAAALDLSPSTLARASDRLEDAGMVRRVRAGRRVLYFPVEPRPSVAASAVAAAA
jgi:predicted transcriptional regulator